MCPSRALNVVRVGPESAFFFIMLLVLIPDSVKIALDYWHHFPFQSESFAEVNE